MSKCTEWRKLGLPTLKTQKLSLYKIYRRIVIVEGVTLLSFLQNDFIE